MMTTSISMMVIAPWPRNDEKWLRRVKALKR